MSRSTSNNKPWILTKEAFDRLLNNLDNDKEKAALKYESFRKRLIKFFEWQGCLNASDLADKVFDRVSRKIQEGEQVLDLTSYLQVVARYVLLEVKREQEKENRLNQLSDHLLFEGSEDETRIECFEKCLELLSPSDRELIINYYTMEKREKINHRREMAKSLGIKLNALRIRSFRIKAHLEVCIKNCQNDAGKR